MRKLKDLMPLELERIKERILQLRESGLSYSEIRNVINAEFDVSISKATALRWCKGTHDPFNKTKRVNLSPSPELAYIIGVYLGDASLSQTARYQYRIRLKVVDRDFAESFENALKSIGANPRTGFEHNSGRTDRWWIEVTNKELFMFLKGPKERLFEIARVYPREFLRGFFDSEGSAIVYPNRVRVEASNYDLEVLELCKELLERLGIHSKIYKTKRKGQTVVIRGKEYQYNSDLFTLRIYRQDSVYRYTVEVGFTIQRKQTPLLQYFKLLKHDNTKSFENTTKSTP